MKAYPKYPTSVSALAFSPDGKKLAIGCSYEHDNALSGPEEKGRVLVLIKETVMDDCKVSSRPFTVDQQADSRSQKSKLERKSSRTYSRAMMDMQSKCNSDYT